MASNLIRFNSTGPTDGRGPILLDPTGAPIHGRNMTLKFEGTSSWSARELIRHAKEHPPEPIIKGLLNKGDILLLHGSEESFKSIFVLQMAESLSVGSDLLRYWKVPNRCRVGVIETEMHQVMMGERLARMFPAADPPENLQFMGESALRDWRRLGLRPKFEFIQTWIREKCIDVLMIDTANDFFRGSENPSDERCVGQFFDELRNLQVGARMIVRHDRKRNPELDGQGCSSERIRGSAEWKEDPEAIIAVERKDRRTHEVSLEVGKLRYGMKPEPFSLWFDAKTFRLTPLSPVVEILSDYGAHSRQSIVAECQERFGLGERKVAEMIDAERAFLEETMQGHSKAYAINLNGVEQAPWCRFIFGE
jgi:AAA domain